MTRKLLAAAISTLLFVGATQSGIAATVAIVDTGLNPGTLGGSLAGGGFDFFNNDSDATDDQPAQHGTSGGVSAIQAAPNIQLIPVKAYGSNFETSTAVLDQAFNFVAGSGARAASHSIGSITNTSVGALQAVTNAGTILVVQAGNAAASGPTGDATKVPSLGGRGIIAGGALNGDIWVASNRAGSLQDFYLMADVRAPINGWVGTSMATPRIAAVAAAVGEAFPFLGPAQVVQVLFDSATDLGAPGVDPVYGNGIVDFNAAMSAVGQGTIPESGSGGGASGGGGGGSGSGIALAALAVGGAVAFTMYNKKEELKKTIFVDKYGRGFNIDLSTRATTRSNAPVFGLFNARQNPISIVPISQSEAGQTLAFVEKPYDFDSFNLDQEVDETRRLGFRHQLNGANSNYVMGLNSGLASEFGALSYNDKASDSRHNGRFLYNQVFTTPILGYSSQGSSFKFGWNGDNPNRSHRFGIAVIDDQEENGLQSNSVLYESRMQKQALQLGFQVGALIEDGNLLGGASDGAFSADKTSTYYIGINGSYDLTPRLSLIGGYFQGVSQVDDADQSVLDEFTELRTEGYGVGLLVNKAFSPRGSFGLSYSSPLQTTSGSARLTLPTSQDRNTGAIGFESSRVSFEGADQEKIVEAYYGYQLNSKSDIFAHYSYTKNPVSEPDMDHDNTFYIGWKREF